MNVTALLLTAAATNSALFWRETTDPDTIALIDAIYSISGADPCVFNACPNGSRILYNAPDPAFFMTAASIEGAVLGDATPAAYDQTMYGEFFGWCRDFMLAYPTAPVFSDVLASCNSSAVDALAAAARAFQTCTATPLECMSTACKLDHRPFERARQAATNVDAALRRRMLFVDNDLRTVARSVDAYLANAYFRSDLLGSGALEP
jgi:hypothetical protein